MGDSCNSRLYLFLIKIQKIPNFCRYIHWHFDMTFRKTFNQDIWTFLNQRDFKNEIESSFIGGCFC